MRDLLVVAGFLLAVPVGTFLVCLAYMSAFAAVQGAILNLGAMRARRLVRRRGSVESLSDRELAWAQQKLDARMALKPLYRNPGWLYWCYELQQQVELQRFSRQAWALKGA